MVLVTQTKRKHQWDNSLTVAVQWMHILIENGCHLKMLPQTIWNRCYKFQAGPGMKLCSRPWGLWCTIPFLFDTFGNIYILTPPLLLLLFMSTFKEYQFLDYLTTPWLTCTYSHFKLLWIPCWETEIWCSNWRCHCQMWTILSVMLIILKLILICNLKSLFSLRRVISTTLTAVSAFNP